MKNLKRIFTCAIFAVFVTLFMFNLVPVNADSVESITNSNGVVITMDNYEKLQTLGFVDGEIDALTQSEYDTYAAMDVISSSSYDQTIETTYQVVDDEIQSSTDRVVSDEENLNELISESITEDEASKTLTTYATKDYKTMKVIGTYYREQDKPEEFFVKVNLTFDKEPFWRATDLIGIVFSNNVQLATINENGQGLPDFISRLTYEKTPWFGDMEKHCQTVDSSMTGSYTYTLNDGLLVEHNLPNITTANYENMVVSLEAHFVPLHTNIDTAAFIGLFKHKNCPLEQLEISGLTVSFEYPYIESIDISINPDKAYDNIYAPALYFNDLISLSEVKIVLDNPSKPIIGTEVTLNGGSDSGYYGYHITKGYTRVAYLSDDSVASSRLDYNWTSSNPSVAVVSAYGTIIAKNPGVTYITATYKGNSTLYSTIKIIVVDDTSTEERTLSMTTDYRYEDAKNGTEVTILNEPKGLNTIHKGYTRALCFTTNGQSYSIQDFTWQSMDTSKATVDIYGYVRALSDTGSVEIVGTCKYNSNIKARIVFYLR